MNLYYCIGKSLPNDEFINYISKTFRVCKNKYLEIQLYHYGFFNFEFTFDVRLTGVDHAGVEFELGILGKYISIIFYDCRHWDDITKGWVK